ncbi:hypothetical protein KCU66_g26, partial [Aureobasidium melanogenum]
MSISPASGGLSRFVGVTEVLSRECSDFNFRALVDARIVVLCCVFCPDFISIGPGRLAVRPAASATPLSLRPTGPACRMVAPGLDRVVIAAPVFSNTTSDVGVKVTTPRLQFDKRATASFSRILLVMRMTGLLLINSSERKSSPS